MNTIKNIFQLIMKMIIPTTLIVFQLTLSLSLFFIFSFDAKRVFQHSVDINSFFDGNIGNAYMLNLNTDNVTLKDLYNAYDEINQKLNIDSFASYTNTAVALGNGGEIYPAIQVSERIPKFKALKMYEGRYFDNQDFIYKEDAIVPVIIGYDLYKTNKYKIGSTFDVGGQKNKIIGVLDKGNVWPDQQVVTNGAITELGNTVLLPELLDQYSRPNFVYYFVIDKNTSDKGLYISQLKQILKKHHVVASINSVKAEADQEQNRLIEGNMLWLVFSLIFVLLSSAAIAITLISIIMNNKKSIGIKIAVGGSISYMKKLYILELFFIYVVSFLISLYMTKNSFGDTIDLWKELLSKEVLGIVLLVSLAVCLPTVIAVLNTFRKLQPKELIGGKD